MSDRIAAVLLPSGLAVNEYSLFLNNLEPEGKRTMKAHRSDADRWFDGLRRVDRNFFRSTRSNIFLTIADKIFKKQGRLPDVVAHYTDGFGFSGIINSNKIYCTSLSRLNDKREIHDAKEVAAPILNDKAACFMTGSDSKEFLLYAAIRLAEVGAKEPIRSFVSSFSSRIDDLKQWQVYGRNNGVSLQFNTHALVDQISDRAGFYFIKCVYDPDEQRELIRTVIECGLEEYATVLKVRGGRELKLCMEAVLYGIAPFLAMVKPSDWSSEDEWRLLYYNALGEGNVHPVDMLTTADSLKRKVDFSFGNNGLGSCMVNVMVGPSNEALLNKQGAEAGLDARGLHIPVLTSRVPLR